MAWMMRGSGAPSDVGKKGGSTEGRYPSSSALEHT